MPTLCVLLLAAVLWLLNHPHIGFLNSDAEIYALLALHWLDPAAYARMKYEVENSARPGIFGRTLGVFSTRPDTSALMDG